MTGEGPFVYLRSRWMVLLPPDLLGGRQEVGHEAERLTGVALGRLR
jgi:hypothetical protein